MFKNKKPVDLTRLLGLLFQEISFRDEEGIYKIISRENEIISRGNEILFRENLIIFAKRKYK